jgi:NADH-quinone oxidoreductase subunit G
VCPFCANGCNIEIHHREGQIYRFRPRYNPEVNDYWMCDEGRLGYRRVQGEGRLLHPLLRRDDDLRGVSWPEALEAVAGRLGAIRREAGGGAVGAVVSAFATNEEAFLVRRLLGGPGARIAGHAWSPPDARGDDLLIKADKNPNRRGLESLGIPTSAEAVDGMLDVIRAGSLKGLVVFGADLVGNVGRERVEDALEGLELLVLIDVRRTETSLYADAVLPAASFAETDGTFTNHAGRVQRVQRAFSPPGEALEGWRLVADLIKALGDSGSWPSADAVFAALSSEAKAFSGLDYPRLGLGGAPALASS